MSAPEIALPNAPAVGRQLMHAGRKPVSLWRMSSRAFFQTRLAPFGLALVIIAVLMAVLAPLVSPYDPNFGDFSSVLAKPSWSHPLGTDELGRDILSRLLYGSTVSLQVGFGATLLTTFIGVVVGISTGYFGGWVDELVMRFTDGMLAFPSLILALAIAAVFEPSITSILLAIAIVSFSTMARLARASTLMVREQEYIEAARASGASTPRLIVFHILPNCLSPVIVQFALLASYGILAEASLSFLGVGVRPPPGVVGRHVAIGVPIFGDCPVALDRPRLDDFPDRSRLQPRRRRPARGVQPEDPGRCVIGRVAFWFLERWLIGASAPNTVIPTKEAAKRYPWRSASAVGRPDGPCPKRRPRCRVLSFRFAPLRTGMSRKLDMTIRKGTL